MSKIKMTGYEDLTYHSPVLAVHSSPVKRKKSGGGPKSKKSAIGMRKYGDSEKRDDDIPQNPNFKFKGARFALTYTSTTMDADIDKQALLDFVSQWYAVKYYGICHESHKSGRIHTHALFWLEKQVCISKCTKFDFEHNEVWLHPNFKALNTEDHWENWSNYIFKDDDEPLTNFEQGKNFNQCAQLIAKIEKHSTWSAVLRDPEICAEVQTKMQWAKTIFNTRRLRAEAVVWDTPRAYQTYAESLLMKERSRAAGTERLILWIYSKARGTGKSQTIDYLCAKHDWTYLAGVWVFKDMMMLYQQQRILHWEVTANEEIHKTMTKVLEDFSDTGKVASGSKYDGGQARMESHIVVTSNQKPPFELLQNRIVAIEASETDALFIQDNWSKRGAVITTQYADGQYTSNVSPNIKEESLTNFLERNTPPAHANTFNMH